MRHPRRRHQHTPTVIEHDDEDFADMENRNPEEFLDRAHPANDQYMQAIEHVQRKILYASRCLRPKQVNILKDVFAGMSYVEAADKNLCDQTTVSRLAKSDKGKTLLNLLQYHLKLLDGPNTALRRNMLWRIAATVELTDPKTAIKAIEALNKMAFQKYQIENPQPETTEQNSGVVININQQLLPKGALDA